MPVQALGCRSTTHGLQLTAGSAQPLRRAGRDTTAARMEPKQGWHFILHQALLLFGFVFVFVFSPEQKRGCPSGQDLLGLGWWVVADAHRQV